MTKNKLTVGVNFFEATVEVKLIVRLIQNFGKFSDCFELIEAAFFSKETPKLQDLSQMQYGMCLILALSDSFL